MTTQRSSQAVLDRMKTSLVGRDSELRRLARLLRDTGLGLPRVALVAGEPGIGKTSLIDGFCALARRRGFEVVSVRAQPGTSDVRAGTLLSVLPAAPPAGDDASVLWWLRNTLAGVGERLAVVVDDAHLADDMTLAVCAHLAESGRAPALFAARSTEPFPDGLAHISELDGADQLNLESLDLEDTAELIEQIVGDTVDRTSIEEVFRLTGGVPLMVIELVRAAAETGAPVSSGGWRWNRTIASDARLGSLFAARLRHTSEDTRRLLWMIVAGQGRIPALAGITAVSQEAVDEAVERGLLTTDGSWLSWSHALLGELAIESVSGATVDSAGQMLADSLAGIGLDDPDVVRLAATLDLASQQPDQMLQLTAAQRLLDLGRYRDAVVHASTAASAGPDSHDACLVAALAATSAGHRDAQAWIRRALRTANVDTQLLDATAQVVTRILGVLGDGAAANSLVSEVQHRTSDPCLRSRLEYLKLVVGIVALPPDEFVAAAKDYLASDDVHPDDRRGVLGNLSIMLAALGEIDRASEYAASARGHIDSLLTIYDRQAGFFGGALAELFGGNAIAATELVAEGSEKATGPFGSQIEIGSRSLRHTLGAPRGHCSTRMPNLVSDADNSGSLRYGVMTRIYSVWELALRRDPEADLLWAELQSAPPHLRNGPAFLESFAAVALLASHGHTDEAADLALDLAETMAPARSAAAWLLHDAARHGRSSDVIDKLDAIAATQPRRFLPALFADSARAISSGDSDQLISVAAEFRTSGFDLFAAELDTLAARQFRSAREGGAARDAIGRARADLRRSGDPWTPIIDTIERHPLTDRQREICRRVVDGLTNQEIADEFGISKRTVENQLHRAYAELGVGRDGLSTVPL